MQHGFLCPQIHFLIDSNITDHCLLWLTMMSFRKPQAEEAFSYDEQYRVEVYAGGFSDGFFNLTEWIRMWTFIYMTEQRTFNICLAHLKRALPPARPSTIDLISLRQCNKPRGILEMELAYDDCLSEQLPRMQIKTGTPLWPLCSPCSSLKQGLLFDLLLPMFTADQDGLLHLRELVAVTYKRLYHCFPSQTF